MYKINLIIQFLAINITITNSIYGLQFLDSSASKIEKYTIYIVHGTNGLIVDENYHNGLANLLFQLNNYNNKNLIIDGGDNEIDHLFYQTYFKNTDYQKINKEYSLFSAYKYYLIDDLFRRSYNTNSKKIIYEKNIIINKGSEYKNNHITINITSYYPHQLTLFTHNDGYLKKQSKPNKDNFFNIIITNKAPLTKYNHWLSMSHKPTLENLIEEKNKIDLIISNDKYQYLDEVQINSQIKLPLYNQVPIVRLGSFPRKIVSFTIHHVNYYKIGYEVKIHDLFKEKFIPKDLNNVLNLANKDNKTWKLKSKRLTSSKIRECNLAILKNYLKDIQKNNTDEKIILWAKDLNRIEMQYDKYLNNYQIFNWTRNLSNLVEVKIKVKKWEMIKDKIANNYNKKYIFKTSNDQQNNSDLLTILTTIEQLYSFRGELLSFWNEGIKISRKTSLSKWLSQKTNKIPPYKNCSAIFSN